MTIIKKCVKCILCRDAVRRLNGANLSDQPLIIVPAFIFRWTGHHLRCYIGKRLKRQASSETQEIVDDIRILLDTYSIGNYGQMIEGSKRQQHIPRLFFLIQVDRLGSARHLYLSSCVVVYCLDACHIHLSPSIHLKWPHTLAHPQIQQIAKSLVSVTYTRE